jgi:two-component system, cell cycle sensor histidine kinase and response regulator CckA
MLTYMGKSPIRLKPLDLSEICRQNLPLFQAIIPKGAVLKTDLLTTGHIINANVQMIQQILTNLVTNAFESIYDGKGVVSVTVKTVSPADILASNRFPADWQPLNKPYACLEVTDTGCGISDADLEKLFDPFFSTKFVGRGLGVSTVIGTVGMHGGGVTVESIPDQGSVFRVFLPVSTEKVLVEPVKSEKTSEIKGNGTIILIDDEDQVRKMAKIMLTRIGYTVLEAKDGVEAVDIFQQHQDVICCILSDLTMPRMNGWDTLSALRKISPEIPVILSSGYDEAHAMTEARDELPNAFLGKPYRSKDLEEIIRRVLAKEATQTSLVKLVAEVSSLPSF